MSRTTTTVETITEEEDGTRVTKKVTLTETRQILSRIHPELELQVRDRIEHLVSDGPSHLAKTHTEELHLTLKGGRKDKAFLLSPEGVENYQRTASKSQSWMDFAVLPSEVGLAEGGLPEGYQIITVQCQGLDEKIVPFYICDWDLPRQGYDLAKVEALVERSPDMCGFELSPRPHFWWMPESDQFKRNWHNPGLADTLNMGYGFPVFDLRRFEAAALEKPSEFEQGVEEGLKLAMIALCPETWDGRGVHYSHFNRWTNSIRDLVEELEQQAQRLQES